MEFIDFPAFVHSLRREVRKLRVYNHQVKCWYQKQKGINTTLKEEIKRLKQEKKKLEKENEKYRREIEKYSKTINRYQVALFDHGNFMSPIPDIHQTKKKKGGQKGHSDTNREQQEDGALYEKKRIYASSCTTCGGALSRVNGVQRKILLDIVLNPHIVKLLIESERQWCSTCKKEISAKDERCLPFTEYGMNTFMIILLLRYRCLLPFSKIAMVLSLGYGLTLAESSILSLLAQARRYLGKKYEELQQSIREGKIMYADETGWQVRGINAWMWIMASDTATVYVAAESRGKGIAQEMYGSSTAYSMHDGYPGYTSVIPSSKQLYCWAHVLRFCFEETIGKSQSTQSVKIRDALVQIFHLKKDPVYQNQGAALEQEVTLRIDTLLMKKTREVTAHALLHRLRTQRDGLIRALIISPNGTNNFAEQELRPIALMRKTSFGSDTYTGMERTAVLASIVQTVARTQTREQFFPTLASALRNGFVKS